MLWLAALVAALFVPVALLIPAYGEVACLFIFVACRNLVQQWFEPRHWCCWKPGDRCPAEIQGVSNREQAYTQCRDAKYNFDSMKDIHNAMLHCGTVKRLYIRTRLIGPTEFPGRYNLPLARNDHYASAPEVLSLDGYRFNDVAWSPIWGHGPERPSTSRWKPWLTSTDWISWARSLMILTRHKTNLELWLDAMDFSRIHTLHLNSTDHIPEQVTRLLPSKLTSLQTLLVEGSQAGDFILQLPRSSLRDLTWRNYQAGRCPNGYQLYHDDCPVPPTASLDAVLLHLGERLESLDLRGDEEDQMPVPPVPLHVLQRLGTLGPGLKRLTIPLRRTEEKKRDRWPWEELKAVAESLPELTDLTIHFELTTKCQREPAFPGQIRLTVCDRPDQFARPVLDENSVHELSEFLARHKAGKRLARVIFKAGDWSREHEKPEWEKYQLDGKRVWAVCVPDERTGEEGQGLPMRCEGFDSWNKRSPETVDPTNPRFGHLPLSLGWSW